MKTTILNKDFEISELESISQNDNVVIEYLNAYKEHRNCRAYDYIAGENITESQKAAFIFSANIFLMQTFGVK